MSIQHRYSTLAPPPKTIASITGLKNLWLPKCHLTTTPTNPDHWLWWLGRKGIVVQQNLESHRFPHPALLAWCCAREIWAWLVIMEPTHCLCHTFPPFPWIYVIWCLRWILSQWGKSEIKVILLRLYKLDVYAEVQTNKQKNNFINKLIYISPFLPKGNLPLTSVSKHADNY